MVNIAINGLGRMGKLVLRAFIEDGIDARIVLLNDAKGDPAQHAHLLEFDTVHGRWPAAFAHDAESVSIDGTRMALTTAKTIEALPLKAYGVDLVVDCTGVFKTPAKTQPYFDAGVKKIIVGKACSIIFSRACCTPSPDTSRVMEGLSDLLAILSISSI